MKHSMSKPAMLRYGTDVRSVSAELWLDAFEQLDIADLKSLRLSGNQYLGSLAASLLFHTGYVAARKGVLDTFVSLSTHPELGKYVKTVVYDSSYFDLGRSDLDLESDCGRATALLYYQQEDLQARVIRDQLDKAFKCLPNLTTVRYADLSRISYLPGDRSDSEWGCDSKLSGPVVQRSAFTAFGPSFGANASGKSMYDELESCAQHDGTGGFHRHNAAFIPLMEALARHSTQTLHTLSLGDEVHAADVGGIPQAFFAITAKMNCFELTHPCLLPVFRCLSKLELKLSNCWPNGVSDIQTESKNCRHGLRKVLASIENVKDMKLVGLRCRLSFDEVLFDHTWKKLHTIYLRNFQGSAIDLKDFIHRHASSLHRLTLDDFHTAMNGLDQTERDSWNNLIPETRLLAPRLEFFCGVLYVEKPFQLCWDVVNVQDDCIDVDGPSIRRMYLPEDDDSDEELSDTDDDSYLEYDSDDSTPSTASNPRRKSEAQILESLTPEEYASIEWLRAKWEEEKTGGFDFDPFCKALKEHKKDKEAIWDELKTGYMLVPRVPDSDSDEDVDGDTIWVYPADQAV